MLCLLGGVQPNFFQTDCTSAPGFQTWSRRTLLVARLWWAVSVGWVLLMAVTRIKNTNFIFDAIGKKFVFFSKTSQASARFLAAATASFG